MLRYTALIVSLLCLTVLVANGAIFQFTMICMGADFNSFQQCIILATISAGCIFGSFPTVKLLNIFGFTVTFMCVGFSSALSVMLVPLFEGSFAFLIVNQIIQGIAIAAIFLALGVIPATCADYKQKGLFVSILSCSLQLGPCFVMPISGYFCSSPYTWKGAYLLSGASTVFSFVAFYFVYRKVATDQMHVSSTRASLETPLIDKQSERVPYRLILTSPSFWGIMFAAFGDTVGYQLFFLYGPTYINSVLEFEITETGMLAAVPHLVSMITKALGGLILDKTTSLDEGLKVVLLISLPQAAMTLCFAVLTQITAETAFLGQVVLTALTVFSGLEFVGLMSGSQIIGQQYTHILTAALAIQDSLAGLVVPGIVALMAPNYAQHEWKMVFCFLVGLLVVSNASFLALTKVKPGKWTEKQYF